VKFATSRRIAAGATVLAVAGAAAGGAIAQASGGAGPVAQAAANGGISLFPETVEHLTRKGSVGKVTIKNTTNGTLKTFVTVRPWSQNRATGTVTANRRVNLSPYVVASAHSFNLGAGKSRTVTIRVRRTPPQGSLYAALQVFAKQQHVKAHNGIIPQYEVIGRVRLNPKHARPALRIGTANILRQGKNRTLILQVRNTGNTLDAVTGTANITGPARRTVNLTPVAVVPGQVVFVHAMSINGMKKGLYHVTFNVTQGARHYRANRVFGVH
jgi:hypothetical protein